MQINTIFPVGSQELKDFVSEHQIGKKVSAPDGRTWVVKKIKNNASIPPDPIIGPVVLVQVSLVDEASLQPPEQELVAT